MFVRPVMSVPPPSSSSVRPSARPVVRPVLVRPLSVLCPSVRPSRRRRRPSSSVRPLSVCPVVSVPSSSQVRPSVCPAVGPVVVFRRLSVRPGVRLIITHIASRSISCRSLHGPRSKKGFKGCSRNHWRENLLVQADLLDLRSKVERSIN